MKENAFLSERDKKEQSLPFQVIVGDREFHAREAGIGRTAGNHFTSARLGAGRSRIAWQSAKEVYWCYL